MKEKVIEVRAAHTQQQVLDHECAIVETYDTIKEAKERAKYFLTDEFQRHSEFSEPLGYSQVLVNRECICDYFRKEK